MESKFARIVRTFTFRLALVYVGLFSLSVIFLFGFIYTFEMNYLQSQITDSVRMQYNYLNDEYKQSGSTGVEARIKKLISEDTNGDELYLLANPKYEKIVGNLGEWPKDVVQDAKFEKDGQWVHFHIEGTRGNSNAMDVKAIIMPISKWRYLLVGQSLSNNGRVEKTIVQTFWASLLLTMVMALIGATIMTRSVISRINIINRSAYTIMHGHLSARIPFDPSGDEFDDLSLNLNQMLDKIEGLLLSLSQFANSIAHDLRTPLNRIINRLDAGLRTIDEHNPARSLLEKNIQDMQGLIGTFNSILKISELEANTEFRSFEACDLQKIIDNLIELYEPYAGEKEIHLVSSIHSPLVVYGEKNLLTQALANLMDNAIKFMAKDGAVTIEAEASVTSTDIIIADNGPGIPEEYRDKVFEKFFRMEQSRNTKGNGLGLSLVAAIARIHNATISLEDNHPGLRVRISFPQVANVGANMGSNT